MKTILQKLINKPYLFVPTSIIIQVIAVILGSVLVIVNSNERGGLLYKAGIAFFGLFLFAPLLTIIGIIFSVKNTNQKIRIKGLLINIIWLVLSTLIMVLIMYLGVHY